MTGTFTPPAHDPFLGKSGAFEGVARRHGRQRNPARRPPRSPLRTSTNQASHSPQAWHREIGRSTANSETPQVAHALGSRAHIVGGAPLIATGALTVAEAMRTSDASPSTHDLRPGRLFLLAASLSIDNLIVGFALGAYNVSIVLAVTVIGVVSVAMSLMGSGLDDRLGSRVERNSELLAGIPLALATK